MIEKENFTKWRLKIFLFGIPVFFLSIGVLRFIFRVIKKYVIVFVLLLVASSNVFAAVPTVETLSADNQTHTVSAAISGGRIDGAIKEFLTLKGKMKVFRWHELY